MNMDFDQYWQDLNESFNSVIIRSRNSAYRSFRAKGATATMAKKLADFIVTATLNEQARANWLGPVHLIDQ